MLTPSSIPLPSMVLLCAVPRLFCAGKRAPAPFLVTTGVHTTTVMALLESASCQPPINQYTCLVTQIGPNCSPKTANFPPRCAPPMPYTDLEPSGSKQTFNAALHGSSCHRQDGEETRGKGHLTISLVKARGARRSACRRTDQSITAEWRPASSARWTDPFPSLSRSSYGSSGGRRDSAGRCSQRRKSPLKGNRRTRQLPRWFIRKFILIAITGV